MLTDLHDYRIAGAGLIQSHGDRAELILKGATYATLFAYLWRRFGPPFSGWDDHKELVKYYISTPLKGVGFGINCSVSMPCSVSYALSPEWAAKLRHYEHDARDHWMLGLSNYTLCREIYLLADAVRAYNGQWQYNSLEDESPSSQRRLLRQIREYIDRVGPPPPVQWVKENKGVYGNPYPVEELPISPHRQILEAIEAGVRDLLRPVAIRDTYVNALGVVSDKDVKRPLASSKRAGWGCSPQFIDAQGEWAELANLIEAKGVNASLAKLKA